MKERHDLLQSIASTAADYRAGELQPPTPTHIDTWVHQFEDDAQVPVLREVDHVLKKTYFNRNTVTKFLSGLVTNSKLTGTNPSDFWRNANFLRIQKNGNSQVELLTVFDEALKAICGFTSTQCGTASGDFIYLDDVIFSGSRVSTDLAAWIERDAPPKAVVHVIVVAIHTSSEWLVGKRLKEVITKSSKKIDIHCWRIKTIENRKYYNKDAAVLWPAALPDDPVLKEYVAQPHKYPFEARPVGGKLGPFSSEQGRAVLEREFLLAGLRIRANCANPKDIMRPLGFGPFGLGFGSMIVTFRNCPNNCPLALWWGDPGAGTKHPLGKWYPLFPRKTYSKEVGFDDCPF